MFFLQFQRLSSVVLSDKIFIYLFSFPSIYPFYCHGLISSVQYERMIRKLNLIK